MRDIAYSLLVGHFWDEPANNPHKCLPTGFLCIKKNIKNGKNFRLRKKNVKFFREFLLVFSLPVE
jgi:hypothetical protein